MIVDPDFVDHWKTRTLVALLDDDEAAPVYVIRLWAHCQNRRTWIFELPAPALKAICRFPGDAQKFELAMAECGFVARNGVEISIVGWEIYNASLIAAWANGGKGGRPAKPKKDIDSETQGKPTGNPPVNQGDNPRVTHGVTDKSREDKSREEQKPRWAAPDWVPAEAWKDFEQMRVKRKKPLTDRARNLAVSELEKLMSTGQDVQLVIEQSVLHSWDTFYPLKSNAQKINGAGFDARYVNQD